jgi:copper chaperone CopZ
MKKKTGFILMTAFAVIIFSACSGSGNKEEKSVTPAETATETQDLHLHYIVISVEGMTCEGCENTVKGAISGVKGVASATASHTDKRAIAGYAGETPDTATLRKAIVSAGYKVNGFQLIGHNMDLINQ